MKSTRKYILAVCALAIGLAAPVIRAEDSATPPAKKEGGKKDGGPKGEHRGPDLQKELGLTDAQAAEIKKIKADERAQLTALREKAGDMKDKKAEGQKIREATKAKIEALLTPEQKAKFEALRKDGPGGPGKGPKDGAPHKEAPDA